MYNRTDPRAAREPALPSSTTTAVTSYPADYVVFGDAAPAAADVDGSRHWYGRGQNFVVGCSECAGTMRLRRETQPDEWMLLLPATHTSARIAANGQVTNTDGYCLAVIPPGREPASTASTCPGPTAGSAGSGDVRR
jgi:hypothetical protein